MDFDEPIERRGTLSSKWGAAASLYDVPADDNLPMWVADSDYRVPDVVTRRLREMVDHGIWGYGVDLEAHGRAVADWMQDRHGWTIDPAAVLCTAGLVNALVVAMEALTDPGDGIVLFSPVYHAFAKAIRGVDRVPVFCPLARDGERYVMDMDAAQAALTGRERMVVLCSPHNPGGRVWSRQEQAALVDFAATNDLVLVSDEVHADLVYDGHAHVPAGLIDGAEERLVVLQSPSKAFNVAGLHPGLMIVPDAALRARVSRRLMALQQPPNPVATEATRACYSPDGARWLAAQMRHLDRNRTRFEAGIGALPGMRVMPLESTYLAWVDFGGTGMDDAEIARRIERDAGIAANRGPTFGPGGEGWMRFNLATQSYRIDEALARLRRAFADLQ